MNAAKCTVFQRMAITKAAATAAVRFNREIFMKSSDRFIQALAAANLLIVTNGALARESFYPSADDDVVIVQPVDQAGGSCSNSGCGNSGCGNSGCIDILPSLLLLMS